MLDHVTSDELGLTCDVCGHEWFRELDGAARPIAEALGSPETADVSMARMGYQRVREPTPRESTIVLAAFDCARCGCRAVSWAELAFDGPRLRAGHRALWGRAFGNAHWVSTALRHEAARLSRQPAETFDCASALSVVLERSAPEMRG